MFKKFTSENISSNSQVKSSIQRGIRTAILEQYPSLNEVAEELLSKKQAISVVKCKDHINLVVVGSDILFFNERDGPYYPTIRTLHKYPNILPRFQVDRGAIKYPLLFHRANIMCPGLTSAGARLADDVPANAIVGVFAEGKQHALAIGLTKLSTTDIRTQNKGIGVDNIHYLQDGLWVMKSIE